MFSARLARCDSAGCSLLRSGHQESQGPTASHYYNTRRRAADRDLGLFLTLISTSLPSSSSNRISRSIEEPASFPCLRAEILG